MESLPGRNLVDLHPFPNSPSDISCSSGPRSVVSTRETSPASSAHHVLHAPPSGSALFQDPPDQIPSTSHKALEMDRDPFQAVNVRRNKLTSDVSRASHTSPGITTSGTSNVGLLQHITGRPSAPNTFPYSSTTFTPPSTVPRGLYCRDWRTSTASLDSLGFSSSQTSPAATSSASGNNNSNTNSLSSTSSGNILPSPVSPVVGFGSNLSRSNNLFNSSSFLSIANLADSPPATAHGLHDLNSSYLDTSTSNFANMHPVNGSFIAEADMDHAMAYCYDRGDGQYTRLVAVDLLPIDLRDIPRRVASDEGMIVLPVPRMPGPNGQPAENQLAPQVAVTPPPSSPSDHTSTDPIQNRIDSIVASSPHGTHSTASPTAGAVVLANTTRGIDNGHASGAVASRPAHANNNNRRDKIYCDKWIHDGTCAFTQQGCKFKHEMPNDRETQEMLGLFHGYPAWWKKLLAEQQNRSTAALDDRPVSISAGRRGAGAGAGRASSSSGGGGGGGGSAVGPAYTTAWRPVQPGPGHPGESVEDVRPTGFGSGGGSRGAGFGSRGGARQGRASGSFNTPNYGPIGPPSRLGRAAGRGNRASAGPSTSSSGSGASRTANAGETNLYAALTDLSLGGDDDIAAGDTTSGDIVEDGEQRGAKL